MRLEKKQELVLLRLKYLKKEYDYVKEVHAFASEKFLEAYKRKIASLPIGEKDKIHTILNEEVTKRKAGVWGIRKRRTSKVDSSKKTKQTKKLFKEIAKVSHPDTLNSFSGKEKKEKEMLFKKAQKAAEELKYFDLIEVAERLNIEVPPPTQEGLNMLKEDIESMNEKIKSYKKTYAWIWYHESKKDKKIQIMLKYIERISAGVIRT